MKRTLFSIFIAIIFILPISSQRANVNEMRSQVKSMQERMKENQRILLSTQNDVKSKLNNLNLIIAQIADRKQLLSALNKEIRAIDTELALLKKQLDEMELKIEKSKKEYTSALLRVRKNGSFQNQLLFIVSADDFNSMYRRFRYTRQYMSAHRKLAEDIKQQITELEIKKNELSELLAAKQTSLDEQKKEQIALTFQENEQQKIISELNKEQKKVKTELEKQRKEIARLNSEIDKAIEREIAAQKERDRKAAAAAAAKQRELANKNRGNNNKQANEPAENIPSTPPSVDTKLSGTFLQNKGRLPVPITGSYLVVGAYGVHNGVSGKGNVLIDYGGITLQGQSGAKARSVFNGKVTSVVNSDDYSFILVRHGTYITVYCRLKNIIVKPGDEVKTGDVLGDIDRDASGNTTMLFQLRNEKTKLNPQSWLKL